MNRLIAILAGAVLGLFATASPGVDPINAYGSKVSFRQAHPLRFPDFTLEYVGERRVHAKEFGRDILYHDFVVTAGAESVSVSWSAGTGDIGPAVFAVAGKQFWLELVRSDALGRLKANELVITNKRRAG